MIDTAMILAAGRGSRLRPLTDSTPKPLVDVGGQSLLQRHIEQLRVAGIKRIVINVAYLGDKIEAAIHSLALNDIEIEFSRELEGALETAGGIVRALPLLKAEQFVVVNADVYTDFDFSTLLRLNSESFLAHMVMVPVPAEKSAADFYLQPVANRHVLTQQHGLGATFSGISIMSAKLFDGLSPGHLPLKPVLDRAISKRQICAELYEGLWCDVGTLDRLEALRQRVTAIR